MVERCVDVAEGVMAYLGQVGHELVTRCLDDSSAQKQRSWTETCTVAFAVKWATGARWARMLRCWGGPSVRSRQAPVEASTMLVGRCERERCPNPTAAHGMVPVVGTTAVLTTPAWVCSRYSA